MKKLIPLAILVLLLPATLLARAKDPVPNPADYTLTAHVTASHGLNQLQDLQAVIDGRQVQLQGLSFGTLALGDYKARISKGGYSATKPNAYDLQITYEFLFPDGHTRPYALVGLGPAATSH